VKNVFSINRSPIRAGDAGGSGVDRKVLMAETLAA